MFVLRWEFLGGVIAKEGGGLFLGMEKVTHSRNKKGPHLTAGLS